MYNLEDYNIDFFLGNIYIGKRNSFLILKISGLGRFECIEHDALHSRESTRFRPVGKLWQSWLGLRRYTSLFQKISRPKESLFSS